MVLSRFSNPCYGQVDYHKRQNLSFFEIVTSTNQSPNTKLTLITCPYTCPVHGKFTDIRIHHLDTWWQSYPILGLTNL